jgi:cysteinyl-tRNA synthetase
MLRSFERAMDDDLNTPKALASFFEFQRKVNRMVDSGRLTKGDYRVVSESLEEVDSVLGVLEPWAAEPRSSGPEGAPSAEVEALVQERELARKAKDYARADAIRDELKRRGVDVQDTAGGPVWRRLSTSP